jgi:hypothetical protein
VRTRDGPKAPAKPWDGADTLEWTVPSPAPYHTFETPPRIVRPVPAATYEPADGSAGRCPRDRRRAQQRASNRRIAWILLSVAIAFFAGIIGTRLMGAGVAGIGSWRRSCSVPGDRDRRNLHAARTESAERATSENGR